MGVVEELELDSWFGEDLWLGLSGEQDGADASVWSEQVEDDEISSAEEGFLRGWAGYAA